MAISGKTSLWRLVLGKPFLFWEKPIFSSVLVESVAVSASCSRENLFLGKTLLGNPSVPVGVGGHSCVIPSLFWDKPPSSLMLVGVGCRLCFSVSRNLGKTLLREKTFSFRKNPWPFGKTYNPLLI